MSNQVRGTTRPGMPISELFKLALLLGYWKKRDKIQRGMRYAAIVILALSVLGFFRDVVAHYVTEHLTSPSPQGVVGIAATRLLRALDHLGLDRLIPVLHTPAFQLLVIFFLGYLTWNHWKEARKPGYEYAFVKRLWEFQLKSSSRSQMSLADALAYFYPVFARAKVDFLAVFLLAADGTLTVAQNGRYPTDREPAPDYFPCLRLREGVGGMVCEDSVTRYMPWCSTWSLEDSKLKPRWPYLELKLKRKAFLHALRFDFSQGSEVDVQDFDPKIFKESPPGQKGHFQSLLCVPMAPSGPGPGFLQLTFSKSNPLSMSDITMAVVIAMVLGEALASLKKG